MLKAFVVDGDEIPDEVLIAVSRMPDRHLKQELAARYSPVIFKKEFFLQMVSIVLFHFCTVFLSKDFKIVTC